MRILHWFAAAALLAAGAFASLSASAQNQAMLLPVDPAPLIAMTVFGEKSFSVEIADDPDERERGLMFRLDLPKDRGMLFVFETTRQVNFWMKNTPLPLDLVFVAQNGEVKAILPGQSYSQDGISPDEPVRFVLELKRGTAAVAGIATGDVLRHPVIDAIARSQ